MDDLTDNAGVEYYESLDPDGGYDSDAISHFDWDDRQEHHAKLCKKLQCDRCDYGKVNWKKYDLEWKGEMYADPEFWMY